jgi:hypothetical protein
MEQTLSEADRDQLAKFLFHFYRSEESVQIRDCVQHFVTCGEELLARRPTSQL